MLPALLLPALLLPALLVLVALLVSGTDLVAATRTAPQGDSGFETHVRFANRTPFARRQWGTATVPFPKGVFTPSKSFGAAGRPSEIVPFGAKWGDGSARYGKLSVLLDLAPGQETLVKVQAQAPNAVPFTLSPWVAQNLAQTNVTVIVATPGGGVHSAGLKFHELVEATNSVRTFHFRDRIPATDLVYDLWLTFFSGQDTARFELRLTNSSTASREWSKGVDLVALAVDDCYPFFRGGVRSNVVQTPLQFSGTSYHVLFGQTSFYDGQAHEWWGDLAFFDPSTKLPDQSQRVATILSTVMSPLYGVATEWSESGAFGPFGYLPPMPPWIQDGGRAAAQQKRADWLKWSSQPGVAWEDRPLGLNRAAGTTGSQHDFGAAKLVDVFRTALPDRIEELRHNAGEEAQRPVHHREVDGSPVRAANHPRWVVWTGRTHFNSTVSPDRLGKPSPPPGVGSNAHGWTGKDKQHWSSLTLASAYLLTTSYSLAAELDNDAELYLSGHTLESQKPNWSTNGVDASRSVGRTYISMSWNYLCRGRDDLRARMVARMDESVRAQYVGLQVTGPVKPLHLHGKDPRVITWTDYWAPWEEAQAVMGLEACARVTGSTTAHAMAVLCAKNLFTHGWQITPPNILVAFGIAWKPNGQPLTAAQYKDPTWVNWPGSGFNLWSLPATKLALSYGVTYGDNDLALRAWTVLQDVIRTRTPPSGGGWDDYSGWDAVK